MNQIHNRIKLFVGTAKASTDLFGLGLAATKWVTEAKVAAKSIGIAFSELTGQAILSLGYAEGQEAHNVAIEVLKIGTVQADLDIQALEASFEAILAGRTNVICHELFVSNLDGGAETLHGVLLLRI
jgi:hypothetical protein